VQEIECVRLSFFVFTSELNELNENELRVT
jgi:hypothetical protein